MHTAHGGQQNPLGPRRTPHTRGMVLWITVCWTQNMTARDSRLLSDRRAGDEQSAWWGLSASLYPDQRLLTSPARPPALT